MAFREWFRGRGEAAQLSNLRITAQHTDPDYDFVCENLVRGETRYLGVFSLRPKNQGEPSFHARVDDGSAYKNKDPELDIDIKGVSRNVSKNFKAGRNGYSGHHTQRSPNRSERVFEVRITAAGRVVFEGVVSFSVSFAQSMPIGGSSNVTVSANVFRACSHKPE